MSLLALSVCIGPALKDNHLLLNRTIHWGWGSVWNSLKPFKIAKLPTLSFSQESLYSWLTWFWFHVNTTTQPWKLRAFSQTGKISDRVPYVSLYLSVRYVLSFSVYLKKKKTKQAKKQSSQKNYVLLMLPSFCFILQETRLIEPRMKKVWWSQTYVTQLRASS